MFHQDRVGTGQGCCREVRTGWKGLVNLPHSSFCSSTVHVLRSRDKSDDFQEAGNLFPESRLLPNCILEAAFHLLLKLVGKHAMLGQGKKSSVRSPWNQDFGAGIQN